LFSESNSRFLLEVSQKARKDFEALMKGTVFSQIGRVTKSASLCVRGLSGKTVIDASLGDLFRSWKGTLSAGV
jgi:phosphoribosylformylglycinamidine (FGAM) synthase-like enzyme